MLSVMVISSSGNLNFHLKKLEGLIVLGPDGNYALSDEGTDGRSAL